MSTVGSAQVDGFGDLVLVGRHQGRVTTTPPIRSNRASPDDAETMVIEARTSPTDLAAVVDAAVGALDAAGTVIVPTDTVYGVAARIDRPAALQRLFDLKDRDRFQTARGAGRRCIPSALARRPLTAR